MTLRVAVTGGGGVLGRALAALRPDWLCLGRDVCDVRNASQTYATLAALKPHVVVHAAALTEHAHIDAGAVIETNIVGTQHVARIARVLGARVVYISTHNVYPGERGAYHELDDVAPIGVYAWSKYAGEQACWAAHAGGATRPLVVRGSWYTYATRLRHWEANGALVDAWCSRERVEHAAAKLVALVEADVRGVVNIGGPRRTYAEIMKAEGYAAPIVTRDTLTRRQALPYAFPVDSSVCTAKFDALQLALPTHA